MIETMKEWLKSLPYRIEFYEYSKVTLTKQEFLSIIQQLIEEYHMELDPFYKKWYPNEPKKWLEISFQIIIKERFKTSIIVCIDIDGDLMSHYTRFVRQKKLTRINLN